MLLQSSQDCKVLVLLLRSSLQHELGTVALVTVPGGAARSFLQRDEALMEVWPHLGTGWVPPEAADEALQTSILAASDLPGAGHAVSDCFLDTITD